MIGFILGTPLGRTITLSLMAVSAALSLLAWNNHKVAQQAVTEAEIKRQEINNEITMGIIDAIAAARRCRALDGMRWNIGNARCERSASGGSATDRSAGQNPQ